MEIRAIQSKKIWEDFLLDCREKTFLQSWNWGEFQKLLGNKIWRLGISESGNLISVALVVKHIAKRSTFLLVPHGPVVNPQTLNPKSQILGVLLGKLKILAKEEKADFVRINPIWERIKENEKLFKDLGFAVRPLHTHPESSWKLSIEKSEKELLNQMRKTTRYLIKQAEENDDMEVLRSRDINDVGRFNSMHLEVVKHQKFVPFSLEYFKKEFSAFLQDNQVMLFFAKYKGEIIAASFEIFWSGIGFYHHSAMLPKYRKIPASYLLQWEAIKEAKKRGCFFYDFWGYIDPKIQPKHPWAGPTLFKMGFGGKGYEYVKAQDLIISPKYWLNYLVEITRKIKRGL